MSFYRCNIRKWAGTNRLLLLPMTRGDLVKLKDIKIKELPDRLLREKADCSMINHILSCFNLGIVIILLGQC